MSGAPAAAPRPERGDRAGRGGFGQVLAAEWTKFRTVRGWVIGVIVAPLVTVGLGYLISSGIRGVPEDHSGHRAARCAAVVAHEMAVAAGMPGR